MAIMFGDGKKRFHPQECGMLEETATSAHSFLFLKESGLNFWQKHNSLGSLKMSWSGKSAGTFQNGA